MPPPNDRVYAVARAHLDALVAHYVTQGVELPERRYVSDGPSVAWDCEQAVVYVERTYKGTADAENSESREPTNVRTAVLWIEVVRCSPIDDGDREPTADEIETNAQLVLAYAHLIAAGVLAAKRAGELGDCQGLVLGDWQGLGPMGGYVGGRQGVRHQLTGV